MASGFKASDTEDWKDNENLFAPPPSKRIVRGWDRSAVSAHAPRLQGHKVWKKPASKATSKHYDENEAQLELSKEGAGARKRTRKVGAKENINSAGWMQKSPEAESAAPKAALTPNGRKANLDMSRSADRSRSDSQQTELQFVPRKRTNNNHIISPKRQKRQSVVGIQSSRHTLLPSESPAKRPKKAMRKSGRRSSMGIVPLMNPPQQTAMNGQATFDYKVDSPATTMSQEANLTETPRSTISQPSPTNVSTPAQDSPQHSEAQTPQTYTFTPIQPTPKPTRTPRAKTPRTASKKPMAGFRKPAADPVSEADGASKSPVGSATVPKTPSIARSAAIDALLNSPGEAPPTMERARNLVLEGALAIASPIKTAAVTPVKTRTFTPRKKFDLSPVNNTASTESPTAADMYKASISDRTTLTTVEVSVDVEITLPHSGQDLSEATIAKELVEAANTVELTMEDAQLEFMESTGVSLASVDADMLDVEDVSFVERLEDDTFTSDDSAVPAQRPDENEVVNEKITMEEAALSKHSADLSPPMTTHLSGVVLHDPTELGISEGGEEVDSMSEHSSPSSPAEEFSTFVSPSQQLNFDLDAEIARSPVKCPVFEVGDESQPEAAVDSINVPSPSEFELPPPAPKLPVAEKTPCPPTIASYDQEDTDMLLSFVSRVKAAKNAGSAPAPKRKRSLPHSPLKLPLGTITDEGSLSPPIPIDDYTLEIPQTTGSPSKRRRTANGKVATASDAGDVETTPRRSTRSTRLPVKTGAPPPGAPSFIPVRRLGGMDLASADNADKTLNLKRTEEKELAALTRVNTRKNKGGSNMPVVFLAKQEKGNEGKEGKDDVLARQKALKELFEERKRREGRAKRDLSVRWAEELAQFREFNAASAGLMAKTEVAGPAGPTTTQIVLGGEKAKKVGKKAVVVASERDNAQDETGEEKKRVQVGLRSKIALGMAVNGTPAPKRRGTRTRA